MMQVNPLHKILYGPDLRFMYLAFSQGEEGFGTYQTALLNFLHGSPKWRTTLSWPKKVEMSRSALVSTLLCFGLDCWLTWPWSRFIFV